ncbi:MAG: type II toxin-antitoxin system ParD family antitoxin [Sphaerospermopsis kisseleviana]|jgi:antitoxin ParD1/3/4|uniref:Type II toxin-antitoxin system ParD family antitoxin n=3 Tax=Sphaerospermopsis TaxID=752201 RepID=A0ABR9VHQ6_9CYAN|nr:MULTISPECIES: type II toxin-antitoxin system ParD family antitoxin [Sphaerospermopsis]BAZ80158.1 putative transcriptional regulators, CopG/Arc/MetJ family protein [Sphaerospermopsis kisseleviana NIES-73]MBC5796643.1 type II toxin-antitoxin system ParD family antitoxin [Sphaerospermopsis sp. LEGE 00249]MBD2131623.1 type II toxin-antitoxin system ParD family antitoxin [Sphaerospermopsis sp. FACHB-1094]MBE9238024.1 type II toxin-antitoxin system ParD family antitoxin [Sphaerospermopsis aphanizo
MNITLNPEQEQFIKTQLAQGKFPDAQAVINQALQLLQETQKEYEEWVEDVRIKVNEAAAELERGEGVPLETVIEQMQAKFRHAREAKK